MSDSTQEESHTGLIKTPKQLLLTVLFAFVVPVAVIAALVTYVVSDSKPAGSTDASKYALGGMTAPDQERAVAERLRKVGMVEVRESDANRPLRTGEQVFTAQCSACHTAGVSGAPKMADAAAWSSRIATGFNALVNSAMKGKGAMPPQAGGDLSDVEVARGVAYMANSAGAKFAEPAAPAGGAAPAAQGDAPAVAAATPAPAPAAPAAAAPAAAPAATTAAAPAAGNGEGLYKQACAVCHATGVANAPKLGDKAAWAPRVATGLPTMVTNAIKGKNAMPARGGSTASDEEIRAAVEYMVSASK